MPAAETFQVDLHRRCEPVQQCIYCGVASEAARLTLEHVIPFGIGGQLELPAASCDACARTINGQFEQEYLKHEVIDARALLSLPSRSKKRRSEVPPHERDGRVGIIDANQKFIRWERVARRDFPYAIIFLQHELPTFITGKTPVDGIFATAAKMYLSHDYREKMGRIKGGVSINTLEPSIAAREIAKIAHGIAVSHFGVDGFEPFLRPLILGQDNLLNRYIGDSGAPLRSGDLHSAAITRRSDGILLVRFTLFASLGAPTHLAVVGRQQG